MQEPNSKLDDATYDVLVPRGWEVAKLHWREVRSAVGREGLKALGTYAFCFVVLASGLSVSLQTWASQSRGFAVIPSDRIPRVGWSPEFSLSEYWMIFTVALGVGGWLLSGQVTKKWLRGYVIVGLVISVLLLITIGRNANFEDASLTARDEARRLLQADSSEQPSLAGSLLFRLCDEGGLEGADCVNAVDKQASELDLGAESTEEIGACLPGWTLSAFDQWLKAASFDREIAALTALSSCVIGAVDPSTEVVADEPIEVIVVPAPADQDGDPVAGSAESATVEAGASDAPVPGSDAVTEALRVQRSEVMAHQAIVRGADEILSYASGDQFFPEFRFSGVAWLVLLAAGLIWYRQLEIRAGRHRLGPIDVQFESVGDGGKSSADDALRRHLSDETEAVFKEAVIRNVPEPGAVPGSGALAPVGDLIAQSDLPHKTLTGGVVDTLQTIFATKGGFTVTCSVRESGDVASVFVRLRDTRTGHHLTSYVAESKNPEEAAKLAGYWIAGWIIKRSAYVPNWATWSEDDAASFVKMGWEQGNEFALSLVGIPGADLDDATTVNSLILTQRAYLRQLGWSTAGPTPSVPTAADADADEDKTDADADEDKTAADADADEEKTAAESPAGPVGVTGANQYAALEDFARAVHRRPRYPVARYRRGAVLGTMMTFGGTIPEAAGHPSTSTDDENGLGADLRPTEGSDQKVQQRDPITPSRVGYLFGDLVLGVSNGSRFDGDPNWNPADEWSALADDDPAPFSPAMRVEMMKQVARWSNENRVALRWRLLARLRPSERFFWKSFSNGDLGKDWWRLLELERCACAERLEVILAETSEAPPTEATTAGTEEAAETSGEPFPEAATERGKGEVRLCETREKIERRALEPDSHWQLSYNLACFYSIRSKRLSGCEQKECQDVALSWLERALDRPRISQLVREWVVADHDLEPLRQLTAFYDWKSRVAPMVRPEPAEPEGRDDAAEEAAGSTAPSGGKEAEPEVVITAGDSAPEGPPDEPAAVGAVPSNGPSDTAGVRAPAAGQAWPTAGLGGGGWYRHFKARRAGARRGRRAGGTATRS